jgi:hypothetical protein
MSAAQVVELPVPQGDPTSRVVFTQGGKGGVGKTAFSTMLVEWYTAHNTPHSLIDMDTENKSCGSLMHFFPQARKSNIQQARGLDEFVNVLDDGKPIVIADMGSGSGDIAHRWFDSMYSAAQENGVVFTAIGMLTPDPASVFSILAWAAFLQKRVDYLIVKNSISNPADFGYWETDPQADEFRRLCHPQMIEMEYRLPEIEHEARSHGVTMQAVADRKTQVPVLNRTASVWRAQAYRRHLFAEFDRVKDLLLL